MRWSLLVILLTSVACTPAQAQPEAVWPGVAIRPVLSLDDNPLRIALDPSTGDLYTATGVGEISRIEAPFSDATKTLLYTTADHGLTWPMYGFTVGPEGSLYIVGNVFQGDRTRGVIRRATPDGAGSHSWTTVAESELYPRSGTFDHLFNGIAVSPDGEYLYVNSGARTDHGEVQNMEGAFPDVREVPLTSAIFRIPTDGQGLVLPNDREALIAAGYLYAEGVRNNFSLAFSPDGRLFATENSGDRDDGDELNWIRDGHHYGFPWRMGLHDNPQQFPGYDPDLDPFVNPASAAYKGGYFHDDPTFPAPPEGVAFTDPVLSRGPDAARYRRSDGTIGDAHTDGVDIGTFTPHRSPLGLVFDVTGTMPGGFQHGAFMLSWTSGAEGGSPLLIPFQDPAQDLVHIRLTETGSDLEAEVHQIAVGFEGPIDAEIVGNRIYVVEFAAGRPLWEIEFTATSPVEEQPDAGGLRLSVAPNPSWGKAHITIEVERAQHVRVQLFDLLGRRVSLLHEGWLTSGAHRFTVPAGLPAGSYLVRGQGERAAATAHVTRTR